MTYLDIVCAVIRSVGFTGGGRMNMDVSPGPFPKRGKVPEFEAGLGGEALGG